MDTVVENPSSGESIYIKNSNLDDVIPTVSNVEIQPKVEKTDDYELNSLTTSTDLANDECSNGQTDVRENVNYDEGNFTTPDHSFTYEQTSNNVGSSNGIEFEGTSILVSNKGSVTDIDDLVSSSVKNPDFSETQIPHTSDVPSVQDVPTEYNSHSKTVVQTCLEVEPNRAIKYEPLQTEVAVENEKQIPQSYHDKVIAASESPVNLEAGDHEEPAREPAIVSETAFVCGAERGGGAIEEQPSYVIATSEHGIPQETADYTTNPKAENVYHSVEGVQYYENQIVTADGQILTVVSQDDGADAMQAFMQNGNEWSFDQQVMQIANQQIPATDGSISQGNIHGAAYYVSGDMIQGQTEQALSLFEVKMPDGTTQYLQIPVTVPVQKSVPSELPATTQAIVVQQPTTGRVQIERPKPVPSSQSYQEGNSSLGQLVSASMEAVDFGSEAGGSYIISHAQDVLTQYTEGKQIGLAGSSKGNTGIMSGNGQSPFQKKETLEERVSRLLKGKGVTATLRPKPVEESRPREDLQVNIPHCSGNQQASANAVVTSQKGSPSKTTRILMKPSLTRKSTEVSLQKGIIKKGTTRMIDGVIIHNYNCEPIDCKQMSTKKIDVNPTLEAFSIERLSLKSKSGDKHLYSSIDDINDLSYDGLPSPYSSPLPPRRLLKGSATHKSSEAKAPRIVKTLIDNGKIIHNVGCDPSDPRMFSLKKIDLPPCLQQYSFDEDETRKRQRQNVTFPSRRVFSNEKSQRKYIYPQNVPKGCIDVIDQPRCNFTQMKSPIDDDDLEDLDLESSQKLGIDYKRPYKRRIDVGNMSFTPLKKLTSLKTNVPQPNINLSNKLTRPKERLLTISKRIKGTEHDSSYKTQLQDQIDYFGNDEFQYTEDGSVVVNRQGDDDSFDDQTEGYFFTPETLGLNDRHNSFNSHVNSEGRVAKPNIVSQKFSYFPENDILDLDATTKKNKDSFGEDEEEDFVVMQSKGETSETRGEPSKSSSPSKPLQGAKGMHQGSDFKTKYVSIPSSSKSLASMKPIEKRISLPFPPKKNVEDDKAAPKIVFQPVNSKVKQNSGTVSSKKNGKLNTTGKSSSLSLGTTIKVVPSKTGTGSPIKAIPITASGLKAVLGSSKSGTPQKLVFSTKDGAKQILSEADLRSLEASLAKIERGEDKPKTPRTKKLKTGKSQPPNLSPINNPKNDLSSRLTGLDELVAELAREESPPILEPMQKGTPIRDIVWDSDDEKPLKPKKTSADSTEVVVTKKAESEIISKATESSPSHGPLETVRRLSPEPVRDMPIMSVSLSTDTVFLEASKNQESHKGESETPAEPTKYTAPLILSDGGETIKIDGNKNAEIDTRVSTEKTGTVEKKETEGGYENSTPIKNKDEVKFTTIKEKRAKIINHASIKVENKAEMGQKSGKKDKIKVSGPSDENKLKVVQKKEPISDSSKEEAAKRSKRRFTKEETGVKKVDENSQDSKKNRRGRKPKALANKGEICTETKMSSPIVKGETQVKETHRKGKEFDIFSTPTMKHSSILKRVSFSDTEEIICASVEAKVNSSSPTGKKSPTPQEVSKGILKKRPSVKKQEDSEQPERKRRKRQIKPKQKVEEDEGSASEDIEDFFSGADMGAFMADRLPGISSKPCPVCSMRYTTAEGLASHIAIHCGLINNKKICPLCKYEVVESKRSKAQIQAHILTSHRILLPDLDRGTGK